jgi:NADPH:quinone reductase-like Zn-dependent oxidoreductase
MSTMRAVVAETTGGSDVLALVEVPVPIAVGSEFLVKVHAAGVNPIDAKTRSGAGPAAVADWPLILGCDFSGTVVASPYEAHPIKVGDEVYGMTIFPRTPGTYAEYVPVPALFLTKKPRGLSHVEAAAVPLAALTAWGAVVEVAKAHEGQRVLIHAGAGGVGHFAIQFAAFFGAHVITTGSTRNLAWLRELGAHEVIDYTAAPFEEQIAPVDIVIDLVGNVVADTGSRSLQVLRPGGLIVNVPSGSWPTLAEDATQAGVRSTEYRVSPDATALAVITRLIDSGDVRVYVDQVFDLADAAAAHEALESGHTRGKMVLRVAD